MGITSIESINKIFGDSNIDSRLTDVLFFHCTTLNEKFPKESVVLSKNLSLVGHVVFELCAFEYTFFNITQMPNAVDDKIKAIKNNAFNSFSEMYYEIIAFAAENNRMKPNDVSYDFLFNNIIAIKYLTFGYSNVTEFLFPIFEKIKYQSNIDYRTKLQEIAHKIKVEPQYSLIREEGPENQKTFWVSVRVGNKEKIAAGRSKKIASANAAELLVKENYPGSISNTEVLSKFRMPKNSLMNLSKLNLLSKTLNAPNDLIFECLSTSAYSNENKKKFGDVKKYVSMGAAVCSGIIMDIALQNINYFENEIPFVNMRNELVKSSLFQLFFHKLKIENLVFCSKGEIASNLPETVCSDVIKALISSTFISSRFNKMKINSICEMYPKDLIERLNCQYGVIGFEKATVIDFSSFLQELSQAFDWLCDYTFSCEGPENATTYFATCQLCTSKSDTSIKLTEKGANKKAARQNVSKKIVEIIKSNLTGKDPFAREILKFYTYNINFANKNKIYKYFFDSKWVFDFTDDDFSDMIKYFEIANLNSIKINEQQLTEAIAKIATPEDFSRFDNFIKNFNLELTNKLSTELFNTLERI